ncbi:MAG: hypothetical protein KatS3mg031_1987 [Chitinophagales bacterium]|nr:MAG: hypothetical protein KatS3mg031_1987 [Chitinophagales bacterium]
MRCGETVLLGVVTNKNFLIDILDHPDFTSGKFSTHFIQQHPELTSRKAPAEKSLHHAAIAATLWMWHQRETDRVLLKHLPSGWRNNFYKMQEEKFAVQDQEITVLYRKLSEGFHMKIADKEYFAELFQATGNRITCEMEGHRKTFIIAQSAETLFIHDDGTGSVMLKMLPRFPEAEAEKVKGGYIAPMPGEVVKVLVQPGDKVKAGDPLVILSSMKMENTIEAHEEGIVEEVYVEPKQFVEAEMMLVKINSK